MGEGFIVRRGGGGQQTVKPIYNSLTAAGLTSLTLSVTNDSTNIATLYYSVVNTDPAPDQANTFETEFAGKETKAITITGLTSGTTYTVYIKAIAIGEFPSETVSVPNLTTGVPMQATGGTITTPTINGVQYKVHTFTNVGTSTFTVTDIGALGGEVDYLIVAGGGGGGNELAGGGGGGGFLTGNLVVSPTGYTVVVGDGGAGAPFGEADGLNGVKGANSSVFGLTAIGGGFGAGRKNAGGTGGSGGGSGEGNSTVVSGTSGQGNSGGGGRSDAPNYPGGGGGGAGQAGQTPASASALGGKGGDGLPSNIDGTTYHYSGGGGGSGYTSGGGGDGGLGGGGGGSGNTNGGFGTGGAGRNNGQNGQANSNTGNNFPGGAGGANTGGGGGGGAHGAGPGGKGGSGIVIIRYTLQEVS